MWAVRPHLANIFEKLLDQKTFILLVARCSATIFTGQFPQTALSQRIKYAIIEPTFFHTKNEGNNETDRI